MRNVRMHCKKKYEISGLFVDQTVVSKLVSKLFPARESLVSDIPAGDGNIAKPFFTVCTAWAHDLCYTVRKIGEIYVIC